MLNSIMYEVEFPGGQVKDYASNDIAKNMLSQVDDEGYSVTLVDSILYYKRDDSAVYKVIEYVVTRRL